MTDREEETPQKAVEQQDPIRTRYSNGLLTCFIGL